MQSLWMLAAAFLFSLMAVCTKLGAEHFSTFELVFYRSLFGMIVIALWVLLKRQTLRTQFFFSHMKRSFFGTLGLTIWFWTLGVLPLGTSMTLNYTSPLYMALFVSVIALRAGRRPSFGGPLSGPPAVRASGSSRLLRQASSALSSRFARKCMRARSSPQQSGFPPDSSLRSPTCR